MSGLFEIEQASRSGLPELDERWPVPHSMFSHWAVFMSKSVQKLAGLCFDLVWLILEDI